MVEPSSARLLLAFGEEDVERSTFSSFPNNNGVDHPNTNHNKSNHFPESIQCYVCHRELVLELIISLIIFFGGSQLPSYLIRHYERPIPYQVTKNGGDIIRDLYIDREYKLIQSVPDWLLIVSCDIIPLFLLLVFSFYFRQPSDYHSSICSFGTALGITGFLTNSIKLYAGYYRPNFYNYCGYDEDANMCLGESYAVNDSRKSFPSGHSSNAFCSMTILSLFLLGKVEIFQKDHTLEDNHNHFIAVGRPSLKKKLLAGLATTPILWAFYVASSRVHDDMHHPADVVAGSLIGFGCAKLVHRLWYPSLTEQNSSCPYHGQ